MKRAAAAGVAVTLLFIGAPLLLAIGFGLFAARPPSTRNINRPE
jgi:hypothetical protein